jgi:ketosteroid isomerase-like protein
LNFSVYTQEVNEMAEEKIPSIMREFVKTMEDGDVEKSLTYFTDNAVWINPSGTFRGKDELRRYLAWMSSQVSNTKVKECGLGIMVQGNKGFFEHEISGTMEGKKVAILAICAYEFEGGKIKEVRTAMDRLGMAQQVATGGLAKMMVNMMVKRGQKGLY